MNVDAIPVRIIDTDYSNKTSGVGSVVYTCTKEVLDPNIPERELAVWLVTPNKGILHIPSQKLYSVIEKHIKVREFDDSETDSPRCAAPNNDVFHTEPIFLNGNPVSPCADINRDLYNYIEDVEWANRK